MTFACLQVESMSMQGANHFAIAHQALGKWTVSMRAAVLYREDPSVALTKYGDLLAINKKTPALAECNLLYTPEIDRFVFKKLWLAHRRDCESSVTGSGLSVGAL